MFFFASWSIFVRAALKSLPNDSTSVSSWGWYHQFHFPLKFGDISLVLSTLRNCVLNPRHFKCHVALTKPSGEHWCSDFRKPFHLVGLTWYIWSCQLWLVVWIGHYSESLLCWFERPVCTAAPGWGWNWWGSTHRTRKSVSPGFSAPEFPGAHSGFQGLLSLWPERRSFYQSFGALATASQHNGADPQSKARRETSTDTWSPSFRGQRLHTCLCLLLPGALAGSFVNSVWRC